MNWMICYDYGKDGNHVFSEMIENKDTAVDALKAYQEKYDDNEARIVAVVPVDKDIFENYYNFNDKIVSEVRSKRIGTCDEYYEGKIFIKITNIDDADED